MLGWAPIIPRRFSGLARHVSQQVCGYKRRVPIRMPGMGQDWRVGPSAFGRHGPGNWFDHWFRPPSLGKLDKDFEAMWHDINQFRESMLRRFGASFADPSFQYDNRQSDLDVKYGENDFKITLDVSDYSPEELTTKLLDYKLTIQGKHEEKPDDHGVVSREFTRQILIPQDVDLDTIACTISPEGMMKVFGKIKGAEDPKERTINIEKENPTEPRKE